MKLSVAMIVKDEERSLQRALESINGLADEIVVVDTGSTDRTVEIAKSYGAKVYHHPWQNDFALHRNQSINYCTGDWLLVIDADEELLPMKATPKQFKKRLARLPKDIKALTVTVHERNNGYNTMSWIGARFFAKDSNLHYVNAVHNQPRIVGQAAGTDIVMYHYGYSLDKKGMDEKRERSIEMLRKRLEEDPNDYNAVFYLCQTLLSAERLDEAIQEGVRCIELLPTGDPGQLSYYGTLYYSLGMAYLRKKDPDNAYIWINKGLEFFPDDIDLNYTMAVIGYMCKRDDLLRSAATTYLQALDDYKKGLSAELVGFANAVPNHPISPRHVHCIEPHQEMWVREWLEEMS